MSCVRKVNHSILISHIFHLLNVFHKENIIITIAHIEHNSVPTVRYFQFMIFIEGVI